MPPSGCHLAERVGDTLGVAPTEAAIHREAASELLKFGGVEFGGVKFVIHPLSMM